MDPTEIRFIRKAFTEERDAVFLEKSARPPSSERHSKISRHLIQLLAIRKRIANVEMKFIAPHGEENVA